MKRDSYPVVNDGHIVPVCYLRNFAAGGRVTVNPVDGAQRPSDRPVRKVATRKHAYRRIRPDGAGIDDVEASLQTIEDKAAPILRALPDIWPLLGEARDTLANFFAIQLVRVPAWMEWHTAFTANYYANFRRIAALQGSLSADVITALAELEDDKREATERLTRMIAISKNVTSIFASMCWTLVDFRRPIITTCDQPIVIWDLKASARRPAPNSPSSGLLEALEARIPVSPRHAVLMTWSINPDDEGGRVVGASHHAANINAFTIANADRDWFHLPDATVPRAAGSLRPISPELVRRYNASVALSSAHRARAAEVVNAMPHSDLIGDTVPAVKVRRVLSEPA